MYLRRGLKGISLVLIAGVLSQFIGYIIRAVLARNLSVIEFGLLYAGLSLILFISLFSDLGTNLATTKLVSEYNASKNYRRMIATLQGTIFIRVGIAFIFSLIVYLSANFLAINYLGIEEASNMIRVYSLFLFIFLIVKIQRNLFHSLQRMLLLGLSNVIEKVTILSLIIVALFYGVLDSAFSVAFIFLVSLLITAAIFSFSFFRLGRLFSQRFSFSLFSYKEVRKISTAAMGIGVGTMVLGYVDTLILTILSTLDNVAVYNVVYPTAMIFLFFPQSVRIMFFPMVSELWAKKDYSKISEGVILIQRYLLILIIPLVLGIALFAGDFLSLLFGAEYSRGAITLQILLVTLIPLSLGIIYQTVMIGTIFQKKAAIIALVASVINLFMNLILIPFYGIVGAAVATFVSYLFISILSFKHMPSNISLNISSLKFLRFLLLGFVFIASSLGLSTILPKTLMWTLINLFISFIIYIFVGNLLGLFKLKEIRFFIRQFSRND